MARDSPSLLLWTGLLGTAVLAYYVAFGFGEGGADDGDDADGTLAEPALPKRKLVSLWSMLVKNMELHKFQIQQVLYQQRGELAKRGTEIPDEHIALMYKQNFEEILESVQNQILQHFDCSEEELEAATELYRDDPEVGGLVAELESLYLGDDGSGGDAAGGGDLDMSVEKLEAIILEEFGAAWCDAYEKTMREFQAQGRELSEADQHVLIDFQSQASDRAQENLATLLEKEGLTPSDFQRLVLKYQSEPRIAAALQRSQAQQADALARMGLRV